MNIIKATEKYEQWLGEYVDLVLPDIEHKHVQMAASVFPFFRATYYRWAQIWQTIDESLRDAPEVLSVADLHVENYGTWRDLEGRLIWGINDFDEAYVLPYTQDLVRLATSAHLAIASGRFSLSGRDACDAILEGYKRGLSVSGMPFVLAEGHSWLRKVALNKLRNPVRFWSKLDETATASSPPEAVIAALKPMLPDPTLSFRVVHRISGLGSLGRQRFVALMDFGGGKVAREAKATAPSACVWARRKRSSAPVQPRILCLPTRVPDPFVRIVGKYIVRRLAPDCTRITLADLPHRRDESRLLFAMGFEAANIHLGEADARRRILKDVARRHEHWLHDAVTQMATCVMADFAHWKRRRAPRLPHTQ